jgi:hypothetical protein
VDHLTCFLERDSFTVTILTPIDGAFMKYRFTSALADGVVCPHLDSRLLPTRLTSGKTAPQRYISGSVHGRAEDLIAAALWAWRGRWLGVTCSTSVLTPHVLQTTS